MIVTSGFLAALECTKFIFGAPDPAGEAYSAPPDPLAGFKGPTSKRREEKGERKGDGRKEEEPGPQIFWCRTGAGGPISS